jgi:predicted Zn-dependent peptidase
MVILVVGDVEPREVFEQVEAGLQDKGPQAEIKRIFPQEAASVAQSYVEQQLSVSMPMFQMGFKDNRLDTRGIECLQHEVAVKLLLEMLLGRSSELYSELYSEGLVNSTFEFDYSIEESYAFSMFGGESPDPAKVKDRIAGAIEKLHKNGLDPASYDRLRKAQLGRFMRQLNSVERISHSFISVYFKGVNLFDYLDVYDKITFEYVKSIFNEHFNLDHLALSVIKPL